MSGRDEIAVYYQVGGCEYRITLADHAVFEAWIPEERRWGPQSWSEIVATDWLEVIRAMAKTVLPVELSDGKLCYPATDYSARLSELHGIAHVRLHTPAAIARMTPEERDEHRACMKRVEAAASAQLQYLENGGKQ